MKVLQINSFGNLSTGNIATNIYKTLKINNYEGKVAFARSTIDTSVPYIKIGNKLNMVIDGIMTRITDKAGFYSKYATKKLIKEIEKYNPDIIHLHNLHGYYLNIEILFNYLKICEKPIVWTLHDCWPFTGHCCYYNMVECYKWKNECFDCIQKNMYPSSKIIDNSTNNYKNKKKLFLDVPNMNIVSVSKWLENEINDSFLREYPTRVIYNGIDFDKFKPTDSNLRQKYGIEDKFIILGVASTWDIRKGLNDFIKLSEILDNNFQIIIIGVDKKQKKLLPKNIIAIERTNNIEELASFYTMADIFFNASIEETFGLPTIESVACGTPAIVYNTTALPEVVNEEYGFIVEKQDVNEVVNVIHKLYSKRENIKFDNTEIKIFDKENTYSKYIELYEEVINNQCKR